MRLTREGKIFAGLSLVVLLAATNTGLNLLYIAFGAMIAVLLLSLPASRWAISGARASLDLPTRAVAGHPFEIAVKLTAPPAKPILGVILDHGVPGVLPLALPSLARGESTTLRLTGRLDRRGAHRVPGLALESRYPFGMIRLRRTVGTDSEILVVPSPLPLSATPLEGLRGGGGRSRRTSRSPGEGLVPLGVRDHRPEDGLRRIHWKSTARTGRLMVSEFEREASGTVALVVDPELPAGGDPGDLERRIRAAASLAQQLLEAMIPVRIVPSDPGTPLPDPAFGLEEFSDLLDLLARLEPEAGSTVMDQIDPLLPRLDAGESPAVITGGTGPAEVGALVGRLLPWPRARLFVLDDHGALDRLESSGVPTAPLLSPPMRAS